MFDTHSSHLDLLDPVEDATGHGLPTDLVTIPKGLLLAVILSSVDRARLSGHDRVELLKARGRLISHLRAELYADIRAVSDAVSELANLDLPDVQDVFLCTSSEVQAALTLTPSGRRSAD